MMRPRPTFLAAALALFALLGGAISCTGNSSTSTYSISGYISDVLSGAPLSGATVTFTSDTLYTANATSDDDGLFEMTVTTDAPFGQVRAELGGYQAVETTVFFDTTERRIDLTMRPEAAAP